MIFFKATVTTKKQLTWKEAMMKDEYRNWRYPWMQLVRSGPWAKLLWHQWLTGLLEPKISLQTSTHLCQASVPGT